MTDRTSPATEAAEATDRLVVAGPAMRSPAHRLHSVLGARFVVEAGWQIPAGYRPIDEERATLRETIAVADVSARGKVDLHGEVGLVLPAAAEGELIARVSDDWSLVLTSPEDLARRLGALEDAGGTRSVMVTDATHLYAGFALAGPRLHRMLERLTSFDPSTLAIGTAAGAAIAEVRAVLVRRDLTVPLLEAYVGSEFGRYVWTTIVEVAIALGGGPVGWDVLRAEGWS